jgi:hypothetical protein
VVWGGGTLSPSHQLGDQGHLTVPLLLCVYRTLFPRCVQCSRAAALQRRWSHLLLPHGTCQVRLAPSNTGSCAAVCCSPAFAAIASHPLPQLQQPLCRSLVWVLRLSSSASAQQQKARQLQPPPLQKA